MHINWSDLTQDLSARGILTLAFRKCHETEFLIQIIHFITHFEYSHSGLGKRIRASHQNLKPLKNRARCLNIFKLLCFMLKCSKALAWFCSGFILQSLIFIWVFFNTLVVDCVFFSSAVMTLYILIAGHIENWYSMLSEKPTWFFSPISPLCFENIKIKDKFLASAVLHSHGTSKDVWKSKRFCFNLALHWS